MQIQKIGATRFPLNACWQRAFFFFFTNRETVWFESSIALLSLHSSISTVCFLY